MPRMPLLIMVPAALILAAVAMLTTQSAFAHERRAVGKYALLVGFNDEPALQGQPNGMQLTVTVPSEANRPVEGLTDTLKASVASGGGQAKEFPLRAQFGTPGRYVADFIPTRPGTYIFNFSGSIEGNPVNERFESGPGRFNDVEAVDQLQFPEAVPPANDVARAARAADDRAAAAEEAAASARSLGIAGVAVGVVGIVVGAIALGLLVARRPAEAAAETRRA
jgi:hypothetical protein